MKLINKFQKNNKIRIVCAMSGGVDSSVAAALLKKQRYDVIGIFLKFWHPPLADTRSTTDNDTNNHENACCNQEALFSAREVATKLKIPFYVLDASKEFKKQIVDYYISEYDNGRTPNPCVVCNKKIKFGWLLKKAKTLGIEYLATGHYARIKNGKLLQPKDKRKDQTYFLWQLTNSELKHVLFPLGDYTKEEVRRLARKFNLPTAEKKESQDICFVEKGKNNEFLANYAKKMLEPGQIFDSKGKISGVHKGLVFYTLGQRHGLNHIQLKTQTSRPQRLRVAMAGAAKLKTGFAPAYVIKLEPDKNRVIVGFQKDLYRNKLEAKNVNLLGKWPIVFVCRAGIRYKSELVSVKVTRHNNKSVSVVLHKPQRAITPGQSIVFYRGKELIGGGVIK